MTTRFDFPDDEKLPSSRPMPLKTTTGAEALRAFHDTHSAIGACRRICRPVDEDDDTGGVLHDFDPLNFDPVD